MPGNPSPVNWGRFDFSDDGDFTGRAKGNGFGAKLGGVYRASDKLSFGLAYHSKTDISDLETNDASVTFNANVDDNVLNGTWNPGVSGTPAGTYSAAAIPVKGKIAIKDFQWPQMIGAGMAYQATSELLVVFDYKWINWSDAMKDFKMTFTADSSQAGMAGSFGSTVLDATMYQNWKNQHVFMIGAGYKVTPEFTARIGANIANNPIPDTYLNPLFPATIKNHYMMEAVMSSALHPASMHPSLMHRRWKAQTGRE